MNTFKKSSTRIFGAFILATAVGLAGCGSPKYTAAPPSEKLSYMGIKNEKNLYGGLWYGPSYQAPRLVVAPELPGG